jgi:hypothetical protein
MTDFMFRAALVLAIVGGGGAAGAHAAEPPKAPATNPMHLKGGESVTAFGSLTVEGEDRIHVEFARPSLKLDLNPEDAPGLDWGSPADVLERTAPDPRVPFMAFTASQPSPYLGRPWLDQFAFGSVATFRPAVTDVARWTLAIADSRGQVVASFQGEGRPPREIVWDGHSARGGQVMPGRVYSSVFEAYDRAGNKRSIVGQGFQVGPTRIATAGGMLFLFAADALESAPRGGAPSLLREAASWIHQVAPPSAPVRVIGIARNPAAGQALAEQVTSALGSELLGGMSRIQATSAVEADAPPTGTIRIEVGRTKESERQVSGTRDSRRPAP